MSRPEESKCQIFGSSKNGEQQEELKHELVFAFSVAIVLLEVDLDGNICLIYLGQPGGPRSQSMQVGQLKAKGLKYPAPTL